MNVAPRKIMNFVKIFFNILVTQLQFSSINSVDGNVCQGVKVRHVLLFNGSSVQLDVQAQEGVCTP